jgi:predicted MFS family arabinose efflux permease
MSTFAQERLGVTLSLAGVLVSLNSITSLLLHPIVGPASNRLDKRTLLMISAMLSVLSCLGFALLPQYLPALLFRIAAGVSWALSASVGLVFASEMLPPEKATTGIAYYGLIQIIVSAVGPTIALYVTGRTGYTGMFLMMTGCAAAALLCACRLPRSVSNGDGHFSLREVRFNEVFAPEAVCLALIGGLFAFNNGVQTSYVLPYAASMGFAGAASVYFLLQAAATLLARILLCPRLYRHSLFTVASFAGILLCLFSLVMSFADAPFQLYLGSILMGIGYGSVIPAIQSACIRRTPRQRQGSAGSTYMFAINIGIGGGGLLGGLVADHLGYAWLFGLLIIPTAAAWLLSLCKGRFPASD